MNINIKEFLRKRFSRKSLNQPPKDISESPEFEAGDYKGVLCKDCPVDPYITTSSVPQLAVWIESKYPGYEFVQIIHGVALIRKRQRTII